eukprot:GHVR01096671.1.p1 GENE.GHVR01096671.1~~GHVR01096671.1.p1  ORF type:complete len:583 (+),score=269.98 GHVR01096671.1:144-1892(+)
MHTHTHTHTHTSPPLEKYTTVALVAEGNGVLTEVVCVCVSQERQLLPCDGQQPSKQGGKDAGVCVCVRQVHSFFGRSVGVCAWHRIIVVVRQHEVALLVETHTQNHSPDAPNTHTHTHTTSAGDRATLPSDVKVKNVVSSVALTESACHAELIPHAVESLIAVAHTGVCVSVCALQWSCAASLVGDASAASQPSCLVTLVSTVSCLSLLTTCTPADSSVARLRKRFNLTVVCQSGRLFASHDSKKLLDESGEVLSCGSTDAPRTGEGAVWGGFITSLASNDESYALLLREDLVASSLCPPHTHTHTPTHTVETKGKKVKTGVLSLFSKKSDKTPVTSMSQLSITAMAVAVGLPPCSKIDESRSETSPMQVAVTAGEGGRVVPPADAKPVSVCLESPLEQAHTHPVFNLAGFRSFSSLITPMRFASINNTRPQSCAANVQTHGNTNTQAHTHTHTNTNTQTQSAKAAEERLGLFERWFGGKAVSPVDKEGCLSSSGAVGGETPADASLRSLGVTEIQPSSASDTHTQARVNTNAAFKSVTELKMKLMQNREKLQQTANRTDQLAEEAEDFQDLARALAKKYRG